MFPPPFREVVWFTIEAGDLAQQFLFSFKQPVGWFSNCPLSTISCFTVAGQRRTCTGFAFKPSHPGEGAPELLSLKSGHHGCIAANYYFSYFMPSEIERQAFLW
jgi:hypothetical protein